MLRDRTVTVSLGKPTSAGASDTPAPTVTPADMHDRTELILEIVEKVATKVFAGICIYVILDTRRQVAVAKAKKHH